MKSFLRGLTRLDHFLAQLEAVILVALLVAMTVVVFLQVIYRYFLAQPLSWSEELARYFFVWICLLGTALSVQKRGHFGMELFYKMLPQTGRRSLRFVISLLMGAVILIILIHGFFLTQDAAGQRSPATGIPMSWIYICLPLGGGLMAIHLLTVCFKDALAESETPQDG